MSSKNIQQHQDPLIDKGWQQMKALLDKEMPVRRRPFAIWYWVAASAAAAFIGILAVSLLTRPAERPSLVTFENPVVGQQETLDVGQEKDHFGVDPADKSREESIVASEPEKNNLDLEPSDRTTQTAELEIEERASDEAAENDISVAAVHSTSQGIDHDLTGKEELDLPAKEDPAIALIEGETEYVDPANKEQEKFRSPESTDFIKGLDYELSNPTVELDATLLNNLAFVALPIEAEESSKKVDFSTEFALITESQYEDYSYDVGVGVRYKAGKTLALGTGAYAWQINADQQFARPGPSSAPNFNTRDQVSVLVPEQLDNMVNSPSQNTEVGVVSKLNYLRFPVYLQFFPQGKWQPRVGMNQIILLSNGASQSDFEQSNGLTAGGPQITFINDFVRKSNYTYEIGLTFQASNRLVFDLSYNHANQSYLNYDVASGDFYQYHRFVRMSAGFRF